MFQSTHPRRVWLKFVCKCLIIKVSIHTPTQGVTLSEVCTVSEAIVSIHTPTQGVTTANGKDEFRFTFQSTHPRRVWLCCSLNAVPELAFQSTHPRRVWLFFCFNRKFSLTFQSTHPRRVWPTKQEKQETAYVSIHTPTQGVTLMCVSCSFNGKVSIHTPTQGVTLYLITYYKSANLIHCYANHHYYSTS